MVGLLRFNKAEAGQRHVVSEQCNGYGFIQWPWLAIWQCDHFPGSPWNELGDEERKLIVDCFPEEEIQPWRLTDVRILDAMGVFDFFKNKAKKVRGLLRESIQEGERSMVGDPVMDRVQWNIDPLKYPLVHGQWKHVLFTVDYSKTKKRLLQEFAAWLDLPENVKRLENYEYDPTGTTGIFKDRLKDLAVWRLHEELGFNEMLKFTEANRKCSPTGEPMPFHDARKGQSERVPRNQAPLYSEPSSCLKAIQGAKDFLARIMPWEFAEPQQEAVKEMAKRYKERLQGSGEEGA